MDITQLVEQFGLPVAMLLYFVYRDTRRAEQDRLEKERLAARITEVEDFARGRLVRAVTQTTRTLARAANASRTAARSMRALCKALSQRPCIAEEIAEL